MNKDVNERKLSENEIQLKDEILDTVGGELTEESVTALTAAMVELICLTAPNLAAALEATTSIGLSMIDVIIKADKSRVCRWHEEYPVQ